MSDDQTDAPSAKSADEAAVQARAIRGRIEEDLRALEAQLPPRDALAARAKIAGGALAGAIAALAALAIALKRRAASRAEEKRARRQAEALARALPEAALRVRTRHVSSPAGRVGLVVAIAALGLAAWARLSTARGADGSPER